MPALLLNTDLFAGIPVLALVVGAVVWSAFVVFFFGVVGGEWKLVPGATILGLIAEFLVAYFDPFG